jgi:glutamate racemase
MQVLPRERLIYSIRHAGAGQVGRGGAALFVENSEFLMERGVKALVVACNTSTALAGSVLRERLAVPVVGVIEPGAEAAVRATRKGKVGVIGTEATISSGEYTRALRRLRRDLEIYTRACPLFVPLAEEGWVDNAIATTTAQLYLSSLRHSGIDALVLGCTHYPLLRKVIASTMGPRVTLVDSATATAEAVSETLNREGLLRKGGAGGVSFFVTDAPDRFIKVGSRFLGSHVDSAVRVER